MKLRHPFKTFSLAMCFAVCLVVLGSCTESKPTVIEVVNASGADGAGNIATRIINNIEFEPNDVVVTNVETPSMVSGRHLIILPSSDEKYLQIADKLKENFSFSGDPGDEFDILEISGNTANQAADTILVVLGSNISYATECDVRSYTLSAAARMLP